MAAARQGQLEGLVALAQATRSATLEGRRSMGGGALAAAMATEMQGQNGREGSKVLEFDIAREEKQLDISEFMEGRHGKVCLNATWPGPHPLTLTGRVIRSEDESEDRLEEEEEIEEWEDLEEDEEAEPYSLQYEEHEWEEAKKKRKKK